jgi:protein phosphatase
MMSLREAGEPRRNVVTRSVGVGAEVEVDIVSLQQPLQPGETLLICSDGLHGPVDDDLLAQAASKGSIERAANDLIDLANERGGPDNITAVLARMDAPQTDSWAPDAAPSRHRKAARKAAPAAGTGNARQRALRMLIIALVALVVALGGLTWVVFGMMRDAPDPTPPGDNAGVATWR